MARTSGPDLLASLRTCDFRLGNSVHASHELCLQPPFTPCCAVCPRRRTHATLRLGEALPPTKLKGASLKDLCALGGLKDHNTILKCYRQTDPVAMQVALEQRGTLRSADRSE